MVKISADEFGIPFGELVQRVSRDGLIVEFELDHRVVARMLPAPPALQVSELNRVFAELPSLGDDAKAFAADIDQIREKLAREADPWG